MASRCNSKRRRQRTASKLRLENTQETKSATQRALSYLSSPRTFLLLAFWMLLHMFMVSQLTADGRRTTRSVHIKLVVICRLLFVIFANCYFIFRWWSRPGLKTRHAGSMSLVGTSWVFFREAVCLYLGAPLSRLLKLALDPVPERPVEPGRRDSDEVENVGCPESGDLKIGTDSPRSQGPEHDPEEKKEV
ncbi:hypothetical protein F5Y03DRAFT_401236 [Xylaria venustula]|nr:hypothetical protein F5Y03DRAFT_401236 [Xylaria venustula]